MRAAFLANGPGEVWGWCRPLILEASRRGWETDVHLLPCPYASGREMQALSRLRARVFSHASALAAFRDFATRKGFASGGKYDVVLQLGGDLMFGRFLAWREKCPLVCYSYGRKKGMEHCTRVLTSRPGLFEAERLEIVGDLVLDSLERGEVSEWNAPRGKRIAAFPGSRPSIRDRAFSLLQGIKRRFAQIDPSVELRVLLSPFAHTDEAQKWRDAGFTVWQGTTPAGINGADLALTQPGTNTLELMYCELPFIVTVPYSFLRLMPLSGVVGMIDKIPFAGAWVRETIIRRGLPKYIGKTAWPNRLVSIHKDEVLMNTEKEGFISELIGEYEGEDIADAAAEILADEKKLAGIKLRLHELAAQVKPGAPQKICDILENITHQYT